MKSILARVYGTSGTREVALGIMTMPSVRAASITGVRAGLRSRIIKSSNGALPLRQSKEMK